MLELHLSVKSLNEVVTEGVLVSWTRYTIETAAIT